MLSTRVPGESSIRVKGNEIDYQAGMRDFHDEAKIIFACNNEHVLKIYELFNENNIEF